MKLHLSYVDVLALNTKLWLRGPTCRLYGCDACAKRTGVE